MLCLFYHQSHRFSMQRGLTVCQVQNTFLEQRRNDGLPFKTGKLDEDRFKGPWGVIVFPPLKHLRINKMNLTIIDQLKTRGVSRLSNPICFIPIAFLNALVYLNHV